MQSVSYYVSESDAALEEFEMEFLNQGGRCLLMPNDAMIIFEIAAHVFADSKRGESTGETRNFESAINYTAITPDSGSALETAFEMLSRMEPSSAKAIVAYFAQ